MREREKWKVRIGFGFVEKEDSIVVSLVPYAETDGA